MKSDANKYQSAAGVDIKNNPAVLATLYNTKDGYAGRMAQKLGEARAVDPQRQPQPDTDGAGAYTKNNSGNIDTALSGALDLFSQNSTSTESGTTEATADQAKSSNNNELSTEQQAARANDTNNTTKSATVASTSGATNTNDTIGLAAEASNLDSANGSSGQKVTGSERITITGLTDQLRSTTGTLQQRQIANNSQRVALNDLQKRLENFDSSQGLDATAGENTSSVQPKPVEQAAAKTPVGRSM
jgi:hypothetical protein